ncbi:MAG: peptidylprolyl isomerase [Colwellia sp.]
MFKKSLIHTLFIVSSFSLSSFVNATIVEFQTNQGNFQVNLFDKTTPKTVENFLTYVDEQSYTNSVVHRVSSNFVVQGGGYSFEGAWPLSRLTANDSVINEPVYSNVQGTIAMAKLSSDINSATNQWFFNLVDNSNLDTQNGGFTVFGQVIGDGMTVINKIANLNLCNNGGLLGIPMVDYTSEECSSAATPGVENFVVIYQVQIIDPSSVTDANLNPIKNTLLTDNDSSGGTFAWLPLLMLTLITSIKIFFHRK